MNEKQKQSYEKLVNQWERVPDEEHKDALLGCYMVRFGNLWIGIELDGYSHS